MSCAVSDHNHDEAATVTGHPDEVDVEAADIDPRDQEAPEQVEELLEEHGGSPGGDPGSVA